MDELIVHEGAVADLRLLVVERSARVEAKDPCLAVVGTLLVERQVHALLACLIALVVSDVEALEVLFGLDRCRRAESFVVLERPSTKAIGLGLARFLPDLIVHVIVESNSTVLRVQRLHDRCAHAGEKAIHLEEGGPQRVKYIHDQSTNMRTIIVCIYHQ